mmetsp:Transcript_18818/g.38980  ORF Transcript_18818/g.38980 Transcript_18818/m.38980 type:complete len:100 (+) Transcript_18818:320-619(+)
MVCHFQNAIRQVPLTNRSIAATGPFFLLEKLSFQNRFVGRIRPVNVCASHDWTGGIPGASPKTFRANAMGLWEVSKKSRHSGPWGYQVQIQLSRGASWP